MKKFLLGSAVALLAFGIVTTGCETGGKVLDTAASARETMEATAAVVCNEYNVAAIRAMFGTSEDAAELREAFCQLYGMEAVAAPEVEQ